MAPILSFLISSGSKKKEQRYICLSEPKVSHTHKMWTEVSSSAPHILQMGLLHSPITYKCLLKVQCPVSRPITTLDCVLLKDNNLALVARSGPEINSPTYLCVLQGPRHVAGISILEYSSVLRLPYFWSPEGFTPRMPLCGRLQPETERA
jgi:hypothetical protein